MTSLPIEPSLPDIKAALVTERALVLRAPPGAGKTTLVPLALVDEPWLAGRTILMLEPRRLATRAAAYRMASLLGEQVGHTVGYRMRGDTHIGRATRIEVITEGVLTRRIQRDPTLDGVGLVIFDEFHERSLDADLGLALTLRTQSLVRDDLRILVMSATLDGAAVSDLLGGAPIIAAEGRSFPVDIRYVAPQPGTRTESTVVRMVMDSLSHDAGDMLVFLPGAAEIRRTASLLATFELGGAVVVPLFGALSRDEQNAAILPDARRRRKIVLATSIAETSLTIEGVRIVIDSGLARSPRFSPRTGMTKLETVRVSLASAEQRRGRAGRTSPGVCYRLWPEYENSHLSATAPPEIANVDLAPLALSLAAAGVHDPLELAWIDPPLPAPFAQAHELLYELEAIDRSGRITDHGRAMNELPVHPRLAHMLVRARAQGSTRLACDLAALMADRDIIRSSGAPIDADITLRLEILRSENTHSSPLAGDVDRDAVRAVRAESQRLAHQAGVSEHDMPGAVSDAGALLALAYPDRIAQRRAGERARYLLRNGRGAELTASHHLATSPFIVAAELDDQRPESRVFRAVAVSLEDIRALFAAQIVNEEVVELDDTTLSVQARRRERLGALVLREGATPNPDPALLHRALLAAIAKRGIGALPWSDSATRLRERMAFLAHHDPSWPSVSDDALADRIDVWLSPMVSDIRRLADLERIDLSAALSGLLDWQQRRALDELAPTHIEVPSGSRIAVDYADAASPVLAVRIQEVFGLTESPRLLHGRVGVTMHLLSPARRPVQVTRDLAGFWRSSYFDVRKDLRGRYPKHDWPEDPLSAPATRRAKPRHRG